jgi:cytochrome c-type biogenesis protein
MGQAMSLSIVALFLAGLLTFLSPCVLPLVPIYLAMLAGTSATTLREKGGGKRLVLSATSFALGLATVFVSLGLAASALGHLFAGHRTLLQQLAGLAIFLAGLQVLGFLRLPGLDRDSRPWLAAIKRSGSLAWPFLFGAAFALGWSPCVGPLLASALAVAGSAGSQARAAVYLGAYAFGFTVPLVAVSAVAPSALRWLDRGKRYMRAFQVTSGTLLATMGLLFITGHESLVTGGAANGTVATSERAESTSTGASTPATCGAGNTTMPTPQTMSTVLGDDDAPQTPTMLEFMSDGCPICKRMAPVVADAERSCSRHGVRVRQIDVATANGRASAGRHGVLGVPTFIFLDARGSEVARLIGQQPRETLMQSLEVLAGQRCDGFRPLDTTGFPGT